MRTATIFILILGFVFVVKALSPIVMIGGHGDSTLNVTVSNPSLFPACANQLVAGRSISVWSPASPLTAACVQSLLLQIEALPNTGIMVNQWGVSVTPSAWGGSAADAFVFAAPFQSFLDQAGYTTGQTFFAAPLDWRYSPPSLETKFGSLTALKHLIETAYSLNHHKKVVIVTYSIGGSIAHYFFTQFVTAAWKNTYIANWVAGVPSLAGTAVSAMVLQNSLGNQIFQLPEPGSLIGVVNEAIVYFSPNPAASVLGTTSWAQSPAENYTGAQFGQLFADQGLGQWSRVWKYWGPYSPESLFGDIDVFSHPGVPTHCIFSHGLPSISVYHFDNGVTGSFSYDFADGDNALIFAVHSPVCQAWMNAPGPSVTMDVLTGISHYVAYATPQFANLVLSYASSAH